MLVKLVVQRGPKRGKVLVLREPLALFGRGSGNAVRIPSTEVSRTHCRLCVQDGEVTVQDLDSLNGTYLNNQRIDGVCVVQPGDLLQLGPARFVIEFDPGELEPVPSVEGEDEFEMVEEKEEFEVVLEDPPPKPPASREKKSATPARVEKPAAPRKPDISEKTPPVEDVLPIPLAEDDGTTKGDPLYVPDDQAWELPEPGELRDILLEMEKDSHTGTDNDS